MTMISYAKLLEVAKRNYLIAKTACEIVKEQLDKANAPFHKAVEEEKISVACWAEIVTDNEYLLGYDKARELVREAEDKLIETAREGLKNAANQEQWKKLEPVFTCKFAGIRVKVLDLALRWSGE